MLRNATYQHVFICNKLRQCPGCADEISEIYIPIKRKVFWETLKMCPHLDKFGSNITSNGETERSLTTVI